MYAAPTKFNLLSENNLVIKYPSNLSTRNHLNEQRTHIIYCKTNFHFPQNQKKINNIYI